MMRKEPSAVARPLEAVLVEAPPAVRQCVFAFLLGVRLTVGDDGVALGAWRSRLANELALVDLQGPDGAASATLAVEHLKEEFTAIEVSRRKHRELLFAWGATLALCALVDQVLGEGGALARSAPESRMCKVAFGHFYCYIAFRYALYGLLIGNALRLSYDNAVLRFDTTTKLIRRPAMNVLVGGAIAYVMAWLIASGKLKFALFGFELERGQVSGVSNPLVCGCSPGSGFVDAGALFAIGLCAGIATDILLQRLVNAAQRSAGEAFET